MRIAELPAPEVARRIAAGHAILLPMGSTETHGPGLPMGDYLLAEAIALRIAEAAGDALVAPPVAFGGVDFFRGVPGGVALSTPTLTALLTEILVALDEGGARRILIINGHGGNIPAIEDAQRALRRSHGVIIPVLHLWKTAGAWQAELGGAPEALGHGGDPVASVALHLRPDLCDAAKLAPRAAPEPFLGLPVSGFGTLRAEGVDFGVPIELPEIAPGGVQATDPSGANAELGARIVARHVAAAAAMLAAMRGEA
ncbi:creatininase family protein [Sediminicoccus sp. BL-A-41-H5]|uniref:creatininase family protein n=1 Tax=Sediminicoccus sp. BL-A-41-H5 TaxID=3421106 RepID=UPI003D670035